jgi:hypothetical protein
MVAAFKEYIFDFTDLRLSLLCSQCGSEIIIDLSNSSSRLPEKCGTCKNFFDENFKAALNDFYSAYAVFSDKKTNKTISAHIRVRSELKD